ARNGAGSTRRPGEITAGGGPGRATAEPVVPGGLAGARHAAAVIRAVAFSPGGGEAIQIEDRIEPAARRSGYVQIQRRRVDRRAGGHAPGDVKEHQAAGAATLPAASRLEARAVAEIIVGKSLLQRRVAGGKQVNRGGLRGDGKAQVYQRCEQRDDPEKAQLRF